MFMQRVYDDSLAQAAYIIGCQRTGEAIVIDPLLDIDRYITIAERHDLRIVAAAETHIHADFLSGVRSFAESHAARVYVSAEGGPDWSSPWAAPPLDVVRLHNNDRFTIGGVAFRAIHTPGHTPEHMIFAVTDHAAHADEPIAILTGDFLFVGDVGRPDLLETAAGQTGVMQDAARDLQRSIAILDRFPPFVQVWPGHGSGSACGKSLGAIPMSTVGYERRYNNAVRAALESSNRFINDILSGQPEPPPYFARMKRQNNEGPPRFTTLPTPERFTPQQLITRRDQPAPGVLIDTRPWSRFSAGHIPGSLHLALDKNFSVEAASFIAERAPIHLIVDERDLQRAIRQLVRVGLARIEGWAAHADVDQLDPAGFATIAEVDVPSAAERIAASRVRVLDVRRQTEHENDHIEGAINIAHTSLAQRLDEIPRDRPLLVHCLTGGRSARAAAYLEHKGFDVVNLVGGINAWRESQPTLGVS